MTRSARRGLAVAIPLLVAACGGAVGPSPSLGPTASAIDTPPAGTSPLQTTAPTPIVPSSIAPSFTSAPAPRAEIVTADASIEGTLGTYVIDDQGSNAPGFSFDTLPSVTVGAKDVVIVRFVDGVAIGDFEVVISPATDGGGTNPQGVPGGTLSADGTTLSFGPLPVGRWVLDARLFRADGRGDGLTSWAVTVH